MTGSDNGGWIRYCMLIDRNVLIDHAVAAESLDRQGSDRCPIELINFS